MFPIKMEMPKLVKVGKRTFYLGVVFFITIALTVNHMFDKLPAIVLKDTAFLEELFKMMFIAFDAALVILLGGKLWSDKLNNGKIKKEGE